MELDLGVETMPDELALGVFWSVHEDVFGFRVALTDKPPTRRGALSALNSIYDPLGMAAPFLLPGKLIMQRICVEASAAGLGWDDPLGEEIQATWTAWRNTMVHLESVQVPRFVGTSATDKDHRVLTLC